MTTQILAQPQVLNNTQPPQPNIDRARVIAGWIATTLETIEALRTFYHTLQSWQLYNASIPDDVFMALVQDLAEAGLLDWLDGSPLDRTNGRPRDIDALREAVTGAGYES